MACPIISPAPGYTCVPSSFLGLMRPRTGYRTHMNTTGDRAVEPFTDNTVGGDDGARDVLPGDTAPDFSAPASTGRELALDDFVGKVPVALTFTGTMSPEATEDLVTAFDTVFAEFGQRRVQALIVTPESADAVRRRRRTGITVPVLSDAEGQLVETYAMSATYPATVVIGESGTVTRLIEGGVAGDHARAVLDHFGTAGESAESH